MGDAWAVCQWVSPRPTRACTTTTDSTDYSSITSSRLVPAERQKKLMRPTAASWSTLIWYDGLAKRYKIPSNHFRIYCTGQEPLPTEQVIIGSSRDTGIYLGTPYSQNVLPRRSRDLKDFVVGLLLFVGGRSCYVLYKRPWRLKIELVLV
jgi:hypothetical protein